MPASHGEHGHPSFLLDPNHLHIWPRHSFMLIALPNKVKVLVTPLLFIPPDAQGLGLLIYLHPICAHDGVRSLGHS